MLTFLTILTMFIVAYSHWREGLFTALCYCVNVLVAGLVAFNFWEPLADLLDGPLRGSILEGYEDFFTLIVLFTVTLALLRLVTNNLCPNEIEYPGHFQQGGGALLGLLTGYLAAGFLICTLETLPWHKNFMNFEPRAQAESTARTFLPSDRVWLSLMRYAGAHSFSWNEEKEDADDPYERYTTFDPHGTFELRYLRYRRYGDTEQPSRYWGEFNKELKK